MREHAGAEFAASWKVRDCRAVTHTAIPVGSGGVGKFGSARHCRARRGIHRLAAPELGTVPRLFCAYLATVAKLAGFSVKSRSLQPFENDQADAAAERLSRPTISGAMRAG